GVINLRRPDVSQQGIVGRRLPHIADYVHVLDGEIGHERLQERPTNVGGGDRVFADESEVKGQTFVAGRESPERLLHERPPAAASDRAAARRAASQPPRTANAWARRSRRVGASSRAARTGSSGAATVVGIAAADMGPDSFRNGHTVTCGE